MPDESALEPLSVVILGTDAVLAAAPATPVQLAHACLAAGYGAVVPASWGDELIATECLRRTTTRGREPVVCAVCPRVTDRLLANGTELAQFAVSLVSPPVATARYLRAMCGDDRVRVTYIGACPGADDESLDERLLPHELLETLAARGIATLEQPLVFDSVIPPDRRRHQSLPGGVPTAEALWGAGSRAFIEIDDDDYVTELAQRIVNRENALLDVAPKLGCACSGAVSDVPPRSARIAAAAVEPPRSATPVIDTSVAVDLVRSLPTAPRRREVVLPPELQQPAAAEPSRPAPVRSEPPERPLQRAVPARRERSTPEGMAAIDPAAPRRRPSGGATVRTVTGAVPTVNSAEGRALPRAYVARRRTGRTPPDNEAISPGAPRPATPERERPIESSIEPARVASVIAPTPAQPHRETLGKLAVGMRTRLERVAREPLRFIVLIAIVVFASMLLGIIAGRQLVGTSGPVPPSADAGQDDGLNGARSLTDEIPPNRMIERGGAVGPELRAPAPASSRSARPSSSGARRAAPDATGRRTRTSPAPRPAVTPPVQAPAPAETTRPQPVQPPPAAASARQDSIDRELQAIARELQLRRARLDSLARRESLGSRPPR